MLGFIQSRQRGASDRLIADVARRLSARGLRVKGFIQINTELAAGLPCLMNLVSVDGAKTVRISQSLGPKSMGCRLDPQGLEEAVGHVAASLSGETVDLLVVNKFGKQEAEGRGFRPLIATALLAGVPVLTAVSSKNQAAFEAFAEGIAMELPMDTNAISEWCEDMVAKQGLAYGKFGEQ